MLKKIKRIDLSMTDERLMDDLKSYREKAIELGATKAEIIKATDILVDERVALKCQVPRCFGYGVGANCPPNTLKPEDLKKILKKYRWAIFFTKDVPSHVIVRDRATIEERVSAYQDVFRIVSEVESMAFYDGHYLAVGFAAGSCRHTFCGKEKTCQAMEGDRCRFSLRSRPSMEAVGIDVYRMVALAGWDIYPIGCNARPEEVVKGTLAGIVIVD